MKKDLRVTISLKNENLLSLRESIGITQIQLAEAAGVSIARVQGFENLSISPIKNNAWRSEALAIADYFNVDPSEIFPDGLLKIKKGKIEFKMYSENLAALANIQPIKLIEDVEKQKIINKALSAGLSQREERVIALLYGMHGEEEHTCQQVATKFDVVSQRIDQIKARALRKLRKNVHLIDLVKK